jgi:UDP-glucose 4-epimerase
VKILIIGSDSFIANRFINRYKSEIEITSVSRIPIEEESARIIPDLFSIPKELFYEKSTVINFAAIVHHPEIKDEYTYNNINCNLALLNANKAKAAGVKLFIQMSSIAVYGNVTTISPDTLTNPQTLYGKSKLKADEGLFRMQDEHFKIASIRAPMVYGGGAAPGNMMRLITLVDKGIPMPFKGINNSRDFINVNNLIQYIKIFSEKGLNGIHLISDNEPVSTEAIITIIAGHLNKKTRLIKLPRFFLNALKILFREEYYKTFGTLNIKTNSDIFGLIKRYPVDHGIKEMIDHYKTHKSIKNS